MLFEDDVDINPIPCEPNVDNNAKELKMFEMWPEPIKKGNEERKSDNSSSSSSSPQSMNIRSFELHDYKDKGFDEEDEKEPQVMGGNHSDSESPAHAQNSHLPIFTQLSNSAQSVQSAMNSMINLKSFANHSARRQSVNDKNKKIAKILSKSFSQSDEEEKKSESQVDIDNSMLSSDNDYDKMNSIEVKRAFLDSNIEESNLGDSIIIKFKEQAERLSQEKQNLLIHINLGIKSFKLLEQIFEGCIGVIRSSTSGATSYLNAKNTNEGVPNFSEFCLENLLMAIGNHLMMLTTLKTILDEGGMIGNAISEAQQIMDEIN